MTNKVNHLVFLFLPAREIDNLQVAATESTSTFSQQDGSQRDDWSQV